MTFIPLNTVSNPKEALLGAQMLFVAFGALVLVPILTGIDSNVALFTAGIGTLIFQLITRGKVPVFLASSFAFLPPLFAAQQGEFTYPEIMCGLVAAGGLYITHQRAHPLFRLRLPAPASCLPWSPAR